MKTYYIEHVSIIRSSAYLICSLIMVLSVTILIAKFIGPGLYPLISLLGLSITLFFIGKKIIKQRLIIGINEKELLVGKRKMLFEDLRSYNLDQSPYLDMVTLRFKNRTQKLNNPLKSCTHNDFKKVKKLIVKKINRENEERADWEKIVEKGFYNSTYSKPYAYFMIALMVFCTGLMFVKSENFKPSNFGLFLVVLAGLVPMLIRIFGNKTVGNNKK